MVVERHPDRSSDVVLLVDSAQDLGVDLETTLRWTVTAAMALGERHLRAQDRVGLIDMGRGVRWLPARLGRRHLHTMIDTLLATEVLPRHQSEAVRVPVSQLPPSATIVAISPLLSEITLSALVELRSRNHEILVIKPAIPEPEPSVGWLARRIFRVGNELNERWLQDRRVVVIPWSTGDSVIWLQRELAELGHYQGTPNGEFDLATLAGVRALQSELGVNVDGTVGPETRIRLQDRRGIDVPRVAERAQPEASAVPDDLPRPPGDAGGRTS